eukprot:COSAG02_NODE_1937_length_10314_cov_5.665884_6_plen_89_part_00
MNLVRELNNKDTHMKQCQHACTRIEGWRLASVKARHATYDFETSAVFDWHLEWLHVPGHELMNKLEEDILSATCNKNGVNASKTGNGA